jgi:uroporphyrinogen-III decarboxylase
MLWLGDDVGTQTGLLVSPETWRRFLKPRMAKFIETVRGINKNITIAYHSDGNILPIVPELIEIGIDVLNPIQPACMDPAEIKQKFGKELCFWGSIDEQHTLPFGSPEDVRNEVNLRLETIGKDGGLIIGPTHHVQLDTPLENLFALTEAVKNVSA